MIHIGEKVIDRARIDRMIDELLRLRSEGLSQQDVASRLNLDRSFVSRVESVGEVRRGGKVALIGWPVANREEIVKVAEEEGCDFIMVMTDAERRQFLRSRRGMDLLNQIFSIVGELRSYDTVIVMGSDYWIELAQSMLGRELVPMSLKQTSIGDNRHIDPEKVRRTIRESHR